MWTWTPLNLFCLFYFIFFSTSDLKQCGRTNIDSPSFAIRDDVSDSSEITAPWLAAIGAIRNNSDGFESFVLTCSGTILTRKMILSAAHCFAEGVSIIPEIVRLGVTRTDQANPQDRKIGQVFIHPDHSNKDWYYDLALISFQDELIFNGKVTSLCLPDEPYTHPGEGVTILVQGWGEDARGLVGKQISEATVSVRSSEECDSRYASAGPSSIEEVRAFLPRLTDNILICADATLNSQVGACHGDSGGPALIRKFLRGAHRFFLIGVVTGNPSSCFLKTLPDVFNFIGSEKILQWIRSHVNKEESENEPTFIVAEDIDKKLQQYSGPCNCSELVMSSDNPVTLRKHGESMGQFSLVGGMAGRPVYRHKQSQDYLFYQPKIEGWLVNDRPGTLYGRIQLQSTKDDPQCPYLMNTVWEYGDGDLGGWVYDRTLSLVCPDNPCSELKCGFRAECVSENARARCACERGFRGDPHTRCFPRGRRTGCGCDHMRVSTRGAAQDHQRDKMGDYYLWGDYNNHPVYQHYSGLDYVYFLNNLWWVGPEVGQKKAGLLNNDSADCPYQASSPWQYGTKDGKQQTDNQLRVICVKD